MRVIRFIVFACFLILFIVIANIIHKNMNSYEAVTITSPFTYYNIIKYSNNDIKTLASLSFKETLDSLAEMFDTNAASAGNNILKKTINIREDDAQLVVFTENNAIQQITVNCSKNTDLFLQSILDSLSTNNIQLEKYILDDENGDILAEVYLHETEHYKIVITKTYANNNDNLSIDYINLAEL